LQQSFAKAKQNLAIPVELEGSVQRQLGVTDSDKVVTRPSDLQTHTTRASPQFPPPPTSWRPHSPGRENKVSPTEEEYFVTSTALARSIEFHCRR